MYNKMETVNLLIENWQMWFVILVAIAFGGYLLVMDAKNVSYRRKKILKLVEESTTILTKEEFDSAWVTLEELDGISTDKEYILILQTISAVLAERWRILNRQVEYPVAVKIVIENIKDLNTRDKWINQLVTCYTEAERQHRKWYNKVGRYLNAEDTKSIATLGASKFLNTLTNMLDER